MTSDQARKLLGGYATNSLTEAERNALFEAALDDQELFDALQQEQALKELLADPMSRNQIQRALAEPPLSRTAGAAWWSRWRAWGGAAGAVAAAVLIVAVIRSNQQRSYDVARAPAAPQVSDQDSRLATAAPPEPQPKQLEPAPRKAVRAARALREPAGAAATDSVSNAVTMQSQNAAAPPPPPPQATPPSVQQAQQSRSQQSSVQVQAGAAQVQAFREEQIARDGERPEAVNKASKARSDTAAFGGAAGFLANYKGPFLRYSLAKRDAAGAYSPLPAGVPPKSGDALRITVFPAVAGYLSLYQLDPSGDWKRLFPAADQGLLVTANASQTIPDSPIVVRDTDQKLRLMLVPVAQAELSKDIKENAAQTKAAAAPLVVDITIGANKVP